MAFPIFILGFVSPSWSRSSRGLTVSIIMLGLLQLACALIVPPLLQQAGASPVPDLHQDSVPGTRGAVASESKICSNIGIDLLQQGGNAADAVSSPV